MATANRNPQILLAQLDARHDELLARLEELNERILAALAELAPAHRTPQEPDAPARASAGSLLARAAG